MISRQLFTGFLLLSLVLAGGCATLSGEQAAVTDKADGIVVETLAEGGIRMTIATDVAFAYGSAVLQPAMSTQLASVVEQHTQQSGAQAVVSGYTDNVGAAAYNLDLSQQRAQTVANVLLTQGFNTAQVRVKGYGESNPVASNANAAGRYRNRRVEVLITSSDG